MISFLKLTAKAPENEWLEYCTSFLFGSLPVFQGLLLLVSGSVILIDYLHNSTDSPRLSHSTLKSCEVGVVSGKNSQDSSIRLFYVGLSF